MPINGEKDENKYIEGKADKVENCEKAVVVIGKFEEIILTNKNNIMWVAYQQGKIFQRFEERENWWQW